MKKIILIFFVLIFSGCQTTQNVRNTQFSKGDLEIFPNQKWELPGGLDYQVSDKTLEYYYKKVTSRHKIRPRRNYVIRGSKNPIVFSRRLKSHQIIKDELKHKSIYSFIYYDGQNILYDAVAPRDRFKTVSFTEESYFPSHSVGKSITSYILGHAICQGYVSSVLEEIKDWPLMENTLYYGQPLIKLLNMTAGDTHVIRENKTRFIETGRHMNSKEPLTKAVQTKGELKNTKPLPNPKYAYSNLTSNIIFNYIMHKVGDDFDKFITHFYQNKVKIKYPVYLSMNDVSPSYKKPTTKSRILQGAGRYAIFATRYDYLRIGKAILEDWQNNTCVGKYLKQIYNMSVSTGKKRTWERGRTNYPNFGSVAQRYAGQFYSHFPELFDQKVIALIGKNGQQIVINLDKSRIVVISAGQEGKYSTKNLALSLIKTGRF